MGDFSKIHSVEFDRVGFYFDEDEPLLDNVTYRFSQNPRIWIRGALGGGRSTIFRLMLGLLPPKSGRVLINGFDLSALSFRELTKLRRHFGFAPDQKGLLSNFTIEQNLYLPFQNRADLDAVEIEARVNRMIEVMELHKVRAKLAPMVSFGHYKAAILGRALINEPQVLLLDEPMSGLNEIVMERFLGLVEECASRGSVKQVIYTGEHAFLGEIWNPEEAFLMHGSLRDSIL